MIRNLIEKYSIKDTGLQMTMMVQARDYTWPNLLLVNMEVKSSFEKRETSSIQLSSAVFSRSYFVNTLFEQFGRYGLLSRVIKSRFRVTKWNFSARCFVDSS